ncbi:VOC family protein [Paenibacillus sp.]|uniref:VOC family protein n=1 Tax=Paenibacillus sp. TaxID=58172 RepID=UPI002D383590|nr:VOC family protein [Paenibacillus sp.]HZG85846.1 VOC family protein [Paenibacillus sp.]
MHIDHVAVWVSDLEGMKRFYETFFEGTANEKYENPRNRFSSYFLSFASGARLELMTMPTVSEPHRHTAETQGLGYVHMAFSTGSRAKVDELTNRLREAGYAVLSEPRVTGDGYYESVVLDPESNRVEITE